MEPKIAAAHVSLARFVKVIEQDLLISRLGVNQLSQSFPVFAACIRRYQLCERHVYEHAYTEVHAHARTTSTISVSWFSASRSLRSAIKVPRRRVTQKLRIVSNYRLFSPLLWYFIFLLLYIIYYCIIYTCRLHCT